MDDDKDSLVIQYGNFKASAFGRFAIVALLASLALAVIGISGLVGVKAWDWVAIVQPKGP